MRGRLATGGRRGLAECFQVRGSLARVIDINSSMYRRVPDAPVQIGRLDLHRGS